MTKETNPFTEAHLLVMRTRLRLLQHYAKDVSDPSAKLAIDVSIQVERTMIDQLEAIINKEKSVD